ncbi:MAG: hypothetical protein H0U75_04850 [Legionella sp.]|nr:hypothetical protein [Legionella sp.]
MNENANLNNSGNSQVGTAANDFLQDGKKLASALYEQGVDKINTAEGQIKDYSEELSKKVQQSPLGSILIAAGVGFILSTLLTK